MILSHTVLPESVRKRVTGSLKERSKDRGIGIRIGTMKETRAGREGKTSLL